jgi:hypothetical protein
MTLIRGACTARRAPWGREPEIVAHAVQRRLDAQVLTTSESHEHLGYRVRVAEQ